MRAWILLVFCFWFATQSNSGEAEQLVSDHDTLRSHAVISICSACRELGSVVLLRYFASIFTWKPKPKALLVLREFIGMFCCVKLPSS